MWLLRGKIILIEGSDFAATLYSQNKCSINMGIFEVYDFTSCVCSLLQKRKKT